MRGGSKKKAKREERNLFSSATFWGRTTKREAKENSASTKTDAWRVQ